MNGSGLILCYHRVAAPESDPQLLCVSPEHFAAHMKELSKSHVPVPLEELLSDRDGKGRIAVTFDDGYEDNLLFAASILEKYRVPAVFYVAAGYTISSRSFWWDELAALLLHASKEVFPPVVDLAGEGIDIRMEIPRPGLLSPYSGCDFGWSVLSPDNPGPGHYAYRMLYPQLLNLKPDIRECAMEGLRNALDGIKTPPDGRPLTPAQIRKLDNLPGLQVGAHTLNHPVLSAFSATEQEREIIEGAEALARMTDRFPLHFSYPYGAPIHFSGETVKIVRKAGFRTAVTTEEGLTNSHSDPLRLPRMIVRNWDGPTFAAKLMEWLA